MENDLSRVLGKPVLVHEGLELIRVVVGMGVTTGFASWHVCHLRRRNFCVEHARARKVPVAVSVFWGWLRFASRSRNLLGGGSNATFVVDADGCSQQKWLVVLE